jgi:hypothetical protein
VVLDAETYRAVATNEFVASEFAAIDAGLPAFASPDTASQRIFVRGRRTYLELFRPDNRFGEPEGKVGIALGVDRPGELECVHALWTGRLPGEAERTRVERQTPSGPIPWYDAVYRPATSAGGEVVVWATEYMPEFLSWLHPDRSAEEIGVAREDFLRHRFAGERLLDDVTGLTVALPGALRDELALQLEAIGFRRSESGGVVALTSGGWALRMVESTGERRGLLAVHLSTIHEKAGLEAVRIGPRSLLVFGPGRRAAWYFL